MKPNGNINSLQKLNPTRICMHFRHENTTIGEPDKYQQKYIFLTFNFND